MPTIDTDRIKENEIARAWIQHDPNRALIPFAIQRQLRAFKNTISTTAAIIEELLKNDDLTIGLIKPLVHRRGVARQRLLNELRHQLPGANIRISHKDVLEISWLTPTKSIVLDPKGSENQDVILCCFLLAWPPAPKALQVHRAWAVEIPDHASGRLLQRDPQVDLRSALFEAGLNFLAADASAVAPHVGENRSIYLTAAHGAFPATVIGAGTKDGSRRYIYARAGTWITDAMRGPDQALLPRAMPADATVALALWRWADGGLSGADRAKLLLPDLDMGLPPAPCGSLQVSTPLKLPF